MRECMKFYPVHMLDNIRVAVLFFVLWLRVAEKWTSFYILETAISRELRHCDSRSAILRTNYCIEENIDIV